METKDDRNITDKPLAISIIVPVYNAELWLARCLDSLLGQTIKNIEIICIDDKSPDASLKILREYEKKDDRIKVIALEKNNGVSAARNAGLAMAAGEYIGFVDSDDFVDLNFYETLYVRAASADADITKGEAREVGYDGEERFFGPSSANIKKNKAYFDYPFWTAIYRRDFLEKNKIDFPVSIIVIQDTVFLTKAVILANKIELVEGVYYRYIRRRDSLYSEVLSAEKLKSNIEGINMIVDFINDKVADDRETYGIVFIGKLDKLLYSEYGRSCTFDGCLAVIGGIIEFYKKCKYKDDLKKWFDENQVKFLSEGNEVELFADLQERSKRVVCFKAFNLIPVLKIIHRYDITEVVLFRWFPLFRVERRFGGSYYYLFFCIPVMKKEKKK
ncbi:MAG: glycosyltransferase [Syntrophorhabdaceae bacterium]|nr:glycosyltransferase [Syntrophorhabdaceae bacterium]